MGGLGSGRQTGTGRSKVEWFRSIDANKLHKAGYLRTGSAGAWQWASGGEQAGFINLSCNGPGLLLRYRVRSAGRDWRDVNQVVQFIRSPCRFGGSRPYFICPGVTGRAACRRRVVKLYITEVHFRCRHCSRLVHTSSSECSWERAVRRANKLKARLSDGADDAPLFPVRPRGMWWRTFERLYRDIKKAEQDALTAFRD